MIYNYLEKHELIDQIEAAFKKTATSYPNDLRVDIFTILSLSRDDVLSLVLGKVKMFYSVNPCGSHLGITKDDRPIWLQVGAYQSSIHYQITARSIDDGVVEFKLNRVFEGLTARYADTRETLGCALDASRSANV
jgi:hypothetical protein